MRERYRLFLLTVYLLFVIFVEGPTGASSFSSDRVVSFDIDPLNVSVDKNPKEITITLHLADNKSGYTMLPLRVDPIALFRSPFPMSNQDGLKVNFSEIESGIYRGTLTLNKESDEGTWWLDSLRLTDKNYDIHDLKKELVKKEFPVNFNMNQKGFGKNSISVIFVCLVVFLVLLFTIRSLTGGKPLSQIYKGEDGASSSSMAQFLIWTIVAIVSYTAIYADRILTHNTFLAPSEIPSNLLLAMGLSAGTTLAAKFVTNRKVDSGKLNTQIKIPKGGILLNEDGKIDLSKVQMMAWTLLATCIYIVSVVEIIRTPFRMPELPDINQTLLLLMGIGEGAYVGKKMVTGDDPKAPRLFTISHDKGPFNTPVTLTGLNFGEKKAGSRVLIGDKPVDEGKILSWDNTQIKFIIPPSIGGETLTPRKTTISLIVNGMQCLNPKEFEVINEIEPYLDHIEPESGLVGTTVILTGRKFGKKEDRSQILINDVQIAEQTEDFLWEDTQIKFKIPQSYKPKSLLGYGKNEIEIGLKVPIYEKMTLSQNKVLFWVLEK